MAEGARQGSGIIYLGTPTNPTLYTARVLRGPSDWQRLALAFVATEPTVRIALLGQATAAGNTVEYDGIRFLPPGRNPVLLMAAIFARFLPHLTLDPVSVAAAAERRNEWLFSGYIPDPGRTDQLLTKMSQECFCTVFKDLDGVYKITADDPDHLAVLHLESHRDLVQETLAVQGLSMDQVYTDFYLWYQRVNTQVTTSQAGQYAAVLYVTPDESISQYAELQTLCGQAADTLHTRTRFDFFCDFIADPATADLLLSRFVRQLSVIRREVSLDATLPALPLSLTDHVAVRAPLLGLTPFVGEVRQATLAFTPQAPGLARGLTLRESGLVRGVWESWDLAAGGPESPPPGAPRVRETWERTNGRTGTFPHAAYVPALLESYDASTTLVAATQVRPGDPVPTDAAFWRTNSAAPAASDPWAPIETLAGGGQGTALGLGDFTASFSGVMSPVGTLRASSSTPPSTLWTLGILADHPTSAYRDDIAPVLELPPEATVSSILEYTRGDTGVRYMLLGTTGGDIYRWNRVSGALELVYATGGGTVQILRRIPEVVPVPVYEAWIESPDGLIILRATYPTFAWTPYTYAALTGTRCSTRIVTYLLDTYVMVATGNEAGDRIDVWNLTHWQTTGAELMHTFFCGPGQGTPLQRPGPLAINPGGRSAAHPYCYLGRVSLDTTPMLELWGFDSAGAPQWQLLQNYASVPWHEPAEGMDTNQGITALWVTGSSRVLYVATGTPYGTAPFPGARIYHYTPGEQIWDGEDGGNGGVPFGCAPAIAAGVGPAMVACWDLDEAGGSRVDHIGGLALTAGTAVTQTGGLAGFAASFVRTSASYLDGGALFPNLVLADFTLACWVRMRSVPDYIDTIAAISHADIAGPEDPRTAELTLYVLSTAQVQLIVGGGASHVVVESVLPLTQEWALLTVWRESVGDQGAVEVHIQLDNGAIATGAGVILSATRPTIFSLGAQRSAQGTWLPMHGDLESFMVWTRVLSTAERAALWQGGPAE